jgi:hypothetical protein
LTFAQSETLVPFTDMPTTSCRHGPTRIIDIRKIDGPFTPKDRPSRRSITATRKWTRRFRQGVGS